MTKNPQFQQELLKKVTEGVKPSDLKRKLKRSKSVNDIPPAPPLPLINDQLKEKQQEIEELRKALEIKDTELTETTAELDDSLIARLQSLKDWNKQQEIIKNLNQELDQTIDQASKEINQGDSEISQLRTKVWTLKSAKENLERELNLTRINRHNSSPTNTNNNAANLNYLEYALYSLGAVILISWLLHSKPTQ